ncbi:MAG: 5-oxoprolinase subunit PxpB [Thermaceae bacterium]
MLQGLYLRFGGRLEEANRKALALARALLANPPRGLLDAVPGYDSLYLELQHPLRKDALRRLLARLEEAPLPEGQTVEIPVLYDGEDLEEVALLTGLSREEVIRIHSAPLYRVYALGFTPGFPFMGEVDPRLRLPRKESPRPKVPAHSVAIAGFQTGIYPLSSPGGWRLLGRALVAVYDPHRPEPFLLRPNDRVRFRPAQGEPPPEPRPLELLPEEPLRPVLRVEEPGLFTLVVDEGRFLVGHLGLARSGALDSRSARRANALVGNPKGTPLLELTLVGPVLTALADVVLGFYGYGMVPLLEGEALPPGQSFLLKRGQTLRFKSTREGVRGYLAVAGGVEARRFLGSASPDLRGRIGRPLQAGDLLGVEREKPVRPGYALPLPSLPPLRLRLLKGPQYTKEALRALASSPFTLIGGDRMGLRLEGPEVPGGEVRSEATPLGGVQVPPSGEVILLLNDKGSLGGYAKPALVHPKDLWLLAQMRVGERVTFVLDSSLS